jgi:hypothetical protein
MTNLRTFLSRLALVLPPAFLAYAPLAYAQVTSVSNSCSSAKDLGTFMQLCIIGFIDNYLVPLVFAVAFIVFLWGVYSTFIAGAANEEKRKEGQKLVVYALIGFFLMFSLWGILNLLVGTFGFDRTTRPNYPTFGPPSSGSTNAGTGANTLTSPSGSGSTAVQCQDSFDCQGSACINGKCDYTATAKPSTAECQDAFDCNGSACINGKCDYGGTAVPKNCAPNEVPVAGGCVPKT